MKTSDIGARIRECRERLAWSQEELAQRSGCTRPMISSYEKGVHKPSISVVEALVQNGADCKYLILGVHSSTQPSIPDGRQLIMAGLGAIKARGVSPPTDVEDAIMRIASMADIPTPADDDEARLLNAFRRAPAAQKRVFLSLADAQEPP